MEGVGDAEAVPRQEVPTDRLMLRREAEREEGLVYLEAVRTLFALDDSDEEPDSSQ